MSSVIIIHTFVISRFPRLFTLYLFNPCTRYTKNHHLSLPSSYICLTFQTLLVVKRASNSRVTRPIEIVIIVSSSRVSSHSLIAAQKPSWTTIASTTESQWMKITITPSTTPTIHRSTLSQIAFSMVNQTSPMTT